MVRIVDDWDEHIVMVDIEQMVKCFIGIQSRNLEYNELERKQEDLKGLWRNML